MKELIAKHPSGQITIIQRMINGTRYIKVNPISMIQTYYNQLIQMFKDKPVKVGLSKNNWIRIKKLGRSKEMEDMVRKGLKNANIKEEEINEDYILNKEAEMLRNQAFIVEVREI